MPSFKIYTPPKYLCEYHGEVIAAIGLVNKVFCMYCLIDFIEKNGIKSLPEIPSH